MFCSGLLPGSRRLSPVSVDIDQLLCLPLPLMPAYGFSWRLQWKPCRWATCLSTSIVSMLWSEATVVRSKIGASSYCDGATSLWRVLTGTPSFHSSCSASCMNDSTRRGIEPK